MNEAATSTHAAEILLVGQPLEGGGAMGAQARQGAATDCFGFRKTELGERVRERIRELCAQLADPVRRQLQSRGQPVPLSAVDARVLALAADGDGHRPLAVAPLVREPTRMVVERRERRTPRPEQQRDVLRVPVGSAGHVVDDQKVGKRTPVRGDVGRVAAHDRGHIHRTGAAAGLVLPVRQPARGLAQVLLVQPEDDGASAAPVEPLDDERRLVAEVPIVHTRHVDP